MTNKLVRDGQVAVLYSPNFGAGWSTWADTEYRHDCLFDPWIADVILSNDYSQEEKHERIEAHCALKYPNMFLGGVEDLAVQWVPEGVAFRIKEYDGNEVIEFRGDIDWITA
jgi:hypothetical protein